MGIKEFVKKNQILARPVYNMLNAKHAKKQHDDNIECMEELKRLNNSHKGERCFVIGTGPSLSVHDLEMLKDEVTFATNRIYELFNQTEWRPTYYVNQDHNLIQTFGDKIAQVDSKLLFLPVEYRQKFSGGKFRFFVLKHKEFYPHKSPFSRDISKYLAQGFTVTYGAIQIAMYMGFKEIYLLGIDHNYSIIRDAKGRPVKMDSEGKNYPEGMQQYMNMNSLPRVEETTIAYETAEKISKRQGVKIMNSTRGGKLEAFERIDLEKILEEKQ